MAYTRNIENWKPDWVALRILDFGRKVHEFGDDDAALAAWVRKMSEDLIYNNASDDFTQSLIYDATEKYCKKAKAGRAGGIAKARKTRRTTPGRGNSRIPDEDSTDCEEFTATATGDNDQPQPTADNRGQAFTQDTALTTNLEDFNDQENASGNYQETDKVSTNNGDAPHGDDGEDRLDTDDGDVAGTTTASEPFAMALDKPVPNKDKATAKTRDSHGSGRYQPPSLDPEDGTNAAQPDSPANDQSDRHKRGREEPATDADIRKDSENMPDAGNGGTPESGTSAAGDSFEARERPSPGEGRKTFATGSSHPVANPPPPIVLKHLQKCGKQKQKANAQSPPRSSEDVRLFAIDKHLDVDDARLWYQMNYIDRPGCDKDGVLILNWKGHCTAYCKAEAERRKAG